MDQENSVQIYICRLGLAVIKMTRDAFTLGVLERLS